MKDQKHRPYQQIFEEIAQLVKAENYLEVLVEIIFRDFTGSAAKIANSDVYETVSYNELALLAGLWIKGSSQVDYPNEIEILVNKTDYLLKELHHSLFFNNLPSKNNKDNLYEMFQNGELFKEAFFYSATAGYDIQYIELLKQKYKYDKEWLQSSRNVNLEEIPGFFFNIRNAFDKRFHFNRTTKIVTPKQKLDVLIFSRQELINNNDAYSQLLDSLVIDTNKVNNLKFNDVADFNEFVEKPILQISQDKYLILLPYYVAEALYESPYYWMYNDAKYRSIAANNRGIVAEEITFNYISSFFGQGKVWRDVNIKFNNTRTRTDIDIIAYTDDKAIVFQIKSKKLTQLSKKGDLHSIKSDFKKAIRDAREQAEISIDSLRNSDLYKFHTKEGAPFIPLNVSSYETVIILLDQYPAIAHQTHIFFGEELDNTPIAFSIFDLETILKYLKTPQQLIDYIHCRTLYSKQYGVANELQYLGHYLEHGMSRLDEKNFVYIDPSYGTMLDSFQHQKIIDQAKRKSFSIARNDKCYCGSGKKYKNCHG